MTEYSFHNQETLVTVMGATDEMFGCNSSGTPRRFSNTAIAEPPRAVTAATTASAMKASGINLASTLLSANTLADPTYAGERTTIMFPSSTAIQTVAPVAATIIGSTVTVTGATKITRTPTSDAVGASITLSAQSTSQWFIEAIGGTGITTT